MRPHTTVLVLIGAIFATSLRCQVVLSELMADNRAGVVDDDGAHGDWVELFNTSASAVGLVGFYLTDDAEDPTRWQFPPVALAAHGYLVVHCSGKDRRDPTRPLHTQFRLRGKRGLVQLVARDGQTVISSIAYGRQQGDRSFGFPQRAQTTALVPPDAEARFLIPDATVARLPTAVDFDDADWAVGRGGFGFDVREGSQLRPAITTDLAQLLRGRRTSAYYRFSFDVADPAAVDLLDLRLRFDAGCVAYLNGQELYRHRASESVDHDAKAEDSYELRDPLRAERVTVEAASSGLVAGRNVLAVQSLMPSKFSLRHFLAVELFAHAGIEMVDGTAACYLDEATPRGPNGAGRDGYVREPKVEPAGGLFLDDVTVRVEARGEGELIHYTLDGSMPTRDSTRYAGPVMVDRSCAFRARAFGSERQQPSTVVTAAFTQMNGDVAAFDSNLPLIVVNSFGATVRPKNDVPAHLHIVPVDAERGRSRLDGAAQFSGPGGVKTRGSSSMDRPKKGYGIELRDGLGEDLDVGLLGMPADADWALYGPHNWDLAHLRNPLCFELARRIGLDAPRWRFVELFVHQGEGSLSRDDYVGLYVLMEKVGRGAHRIDVEKLEPKHDAEPEISGGYILKIDRPGPGDMGFEAKGQRLQHVYPKERDLTDPQRAWLQKHFDAFGAMLESDAFAEEVGGYPAWIDRANWMDYHLFNEFVKNPDAYTLSTFLYKPRGAKLRMGPVWDYDRAIRTNDEAYWVGRPSRPTGWTGDCYYSWWGVLFRDEEFRRQYRARGRQLLAGAWSDDSVFALLDEIAATIAEAEERDRQRWPILAAGEWQNELLDIKEWVSARGEWFRDELLELPNFAVSDPELNMPFDVSLSHDNAAGVLYYTTDGADPRLQNGAVSPRAQVSNGAITVSEDVHIRARVKVGASWSREADRWYANEVDTLAVTELMFNPPGGRDYEFVELTNYGSRTVDLRGVDMRGAVRFHFGLGTVDSLGPGQRVVVVRDLDKFAERYDVTGINVAGTFMGRFSNTAGELRVLGPVGQELARVTYKDDWCEKTDGEGRSMVVRKIERTVTEEKQWRASRRRLGSPGR